MSEEEAKKMGLKNTATYLDVYGAFLKPHSRTTSLTSLSLIKIKDIQRSTIIGIKENNNNNNKQKTVEQTDGKEALEERDSEGIEKKKTLKMIISSDKE